MDVQSVTINLTPDERIDRVAQIAHDACRLYCSLITGDPPAPRWFDCPEDMREGVRKGVRGALAGNTPEESHANWMLDRLNAGWTFGPVLDREAKVHPNLVPYDKLPEAQRRKDALFLGIVDALLGPVR
jgi:hypothetical protein